MHHFGARLFYTREEETYCSREKERSPVLRYKFVILAVLAFLACASAPVMAASYAFSSEDNGKTVHVNPGDTVTLSLKENPSTGFRWIMETSGGLKTLQDSFTPSGTGLIGAGGVRTWKFLVIGTGRQTVSGVYKQAWMPTTGEEARYSLELISGGISVQRPVESTKFRTYLKPELYKTIHF